MNNKKHDVFISYSSKDSHIAKSLVNRLESKGIMCWYAERDIPDGTVWATQIDEAIHLAKIFIVIVSNNSVSSKQVPKEIGLAVNSCEVILPLRVDYVQLEGAFRYYLSDCQWTDITSEQGEKLDKVVDIVSRILNRKIADDYENAADISLPSNKKNPQKSGIIKTATAFICVILILLVALVLFQKQNRKEDSIADSTFSEDENVETMAADNDISVGDIDSLEESTDEEESITEPDEETLKLPSTQADVESIFALLQDTYDDMLKSNDSAINMGKYFSELNDVDIDGDGIFEEFYFIPDESGYSGIISVKNSTAAELIFDGYPEGIKDAFSPACWMYPVYISSEDIDDDGIGEVLFKQASGSTGGIICQGYLFDYADDKWDCVPFSKSERYTAIDIELDHDSVIALYNAGHKNGADQYWDYMGVKYVLKGRNLYETEKNKNLAKEYWPFEYWTNDTSNYSEWDFTVTDEAINQLKELRGLKDANPVVVIGNVFYYERRNIYLKEVTFKDHTGKLLDYVFVDKFNNIIDINI